MIESKDEFNDLINRLKAKEKENKLGKTLRIKLQAFKEVEDLINKSDITYPTTHFSPAIAEMKEAIVNDLKKLSKGYSKLKWAISKDTEIPVDILTVLLKQLKYEGKIELIMIWSEETGMPNGSGYCLTDLYNRPLQDKKL